MDQRVTLTPHMDVQQTLKEPLLKSPRKPRVFVLRQRESCIWKVEDCPLTCTVVIGYAQLEGSKGNIDITYGCPTSPDITIF